MGFIYIIYGPLIGEAKYNVFKAKCYVGQTNRTVKERWNDHRSSFQKYCKNKYKNKSHKLHLYNAMKIHGIETFDCIPMVKYDNNKLNDGEIEWIKHKNSIYPNGYNIRSGGGNYNIVQTEETKKLISKNTSIGITKNIDNYRTYDATDGLPKYISYYKRTDRKKHTHGFNIWHKPSGKRKTIMTGIDLPITAEMRQQAINKLQEIIIQFNLIQL
jgi:hypothetical protein